MKKGYTIIELIIVILIVWVLMVAFQNVFQVKNRDSLYWEACVNNLYGDISNFMYAAITSRAITVNSTQIFPDFYYIDLNVDKNSIVLSYWTWEKSTLATPIIYNELTLTGSVPANYNCKSPSYYMELSWSNLSVTINKWLGEDIQLRSFILSWSSNLFTWEVKFLLKDAQWGTWYKELGRLTVDTRTQNIKSNLCLTINNIWDCDQRSQ